MNPFAHGARAGMALVVLLALGVLAGPAPAQTPLVIGTKVTPPFVLKDAGGEWSGPAIELWRQAADALGLRYTFRELTLAELLAALEKGEIDVAVGALSVTAERESRFDFSHPFHTTGLGIATRTTEPIGVLAVLSRLVSKPFLSAAGALLLVLLLTGVAIYWLERRRNAEQFGGGPVQGIGSGIWWSAVTMTTVGYGDKAPVTLAGRLLAIVWMFVAVITISGFTAAIASSLTAEQLSLVTGPEDLHKVRAGTVSASSSEQHLRSTRINAQAFASLEDALGRLDSGELDAVVYDLPLLMYQREQHPEWSHITVLPATLTVEHYAFALPQGSPLREGLNREIPKLTGTPEWRTAVQGY